MLCIFYHNKKNPKAPPPLRTLERSESRVGLVSGGGGPGVPWHSLCRGGGQGMGCPLLGCGPRPPGRPQGCVGWGGLTWGWSRTLGQDSGTGMGRGGPRGHLVILNAPATSGKPVRQWWREIDWFWSKDQKPGAQEVVGTTGRRSRRPACRLCVCLFVPWRSRGWGGIQVAPSCHRGHLLGLREQPWCTEACPKVWT